MKRYSITDYHAPEMSEDENGEWVKYKDHIEMMDVVYHEPKDLLADIEEGNQIIEKKNKEIERVRRLSIKHLNKWTDLNKAGAKMSAELTYLRGVIECALGGDYPSDIGCETHELNKGVNK